jgi:membrane protein
MARFAGIDGRVRHMAGDESPVRLLVAFWHRVKAHRVTGHAAEMAFFAVLTLVPSTIAVGATLGVSRSVLGDGVVQEAEDAVVGAVRTLMGPELANTVIAPFVHAQLTQANGGVALGGLLAAWWLSSRLIAATGHALDSCYSVSDSRPTVTERLMALAFALGSVVLVAATVEMMVVGPLGDPDKGPARWLGLGEVYTVLWSVVRWPTLLAVVVAFLVCLYRFTPNVRQSVSECLPGAVVGAVLWIVAAVGFRLSAPLGLHHSEGLANGDPTVTLIGQSVNAVVATVIWAYVASIAILLGGEVNAMLRARQLEVVELPARRPAADGETQEPEPEAETQPVAVPAPPTP